MSINKQFINRVVDKIYRGQNRPVNSNDLKAILLEVGKKVDADIKKGDAPDAGSEDNAGSGE